MEDYDSSHSGENIDLVVTKVLNGTCGIQGVKVFGNELTPDANNKVDITNNYLIEEGTWVPYFGEVSDNVSCTYEYHYGTYLKIGSIVYVSARLKFKVNSVGSSTAACVVRTLPYRSKTYFSGAPEYAACISEFSSEDSSIPYSGFCTARVFAGQSSIVFEQNGGIGSIPIVANPDKTVWVSSSCVYPTDGTRDI